MKYDAQQNILDKISGVWIADETLLSVGYIFSIKTKTNLDWVSKPPLYDFSMYNTSDYLAELSHSAELQFLSDKICT